MPPLTATRPPGILLAAWIGLDRLWQARSAGSLPAALRRMAPAAIAPLGLLAFMVFLYFRTGDPLAFQHIQTGWQRTGRNPLAVLADALSGLDLAHPRLGPLYLLGWAVLGLAAAAWLAVRRRFAEAWLCGMTVAMSLASGSLFSMPRYVAASPVFLLAVADLLALVRRPPVPRGGLRQVHQRFGAECQRPPQLAPAIRVVRMASQQFLDDGYFLTQFLPSDGEGAPVIGNVGERVH